MLDCFVAAGQYRGHLVVNPEGCRLSDNTDHCWAVVAEVGSVAMVSQTPISLSFQLCDAQL
jgi:hypothetical protein